NLSHNIQTMLVTGSECPDCTNATSHSASPGRKVQQLVREPWQKQLSRCYCLDFFVTFFIKKKSKERFFRAPVPMKIGRQAKERKVKRLPVATPLQKSDTIKDSNAIHSIFHPPIHLMANPRL